jgi:N-acetylmuramoyl-L-alanine amidase
VSNAGKFQLCLLIALAGCSTAPPRTESPRATDWESTAQTKPAPETVQVPEPPRLAPPPAGVPAQMPSLIHTNDFGEAWLPLKRWSNENGFGSLRWISATPAPTFALKTTNGILVLRADSTVATWRGLELHLGFAPRVIGGQPFVHALDLAKNIKPLLNDCPLPAKTNRVIVIDPGHGGPNTGTKSVVNRVDEKELTLDWAFRLEPLLATNGWQVFLTRTNDVEVGLSNRVAFAEQHQADLFLSLHFNGVTNHEQAGLETYCLTPTGMPSTLTRGYDDNPSMVFPNNAFDAENLAYALQLHRAMLQVNGTMDHGVRRARFLGVLRGQNRPAVLIEGGFLSNPREAKRIAEPEYRQKLAEAIAKALCAPAKTNAQEMQITTRNPNAAGAANGAKPMEFEAPPSVSTTNGK